MPDDSSAPGGGNLYDKYGSRNPVARVLMAGFLRAFDSLTERVPPARALEVGCGEGELIRRLHRRGWRTSACDIDEAIVAEARRRAAREGADTAFYVADFTEGLPDAAQAELVICCEVLEHLERPRDALRAISGIAPFVLFSVPREPLWRALNMIRGAYIADFGNTPGHLQHWSAAGFLAMLREEFDVIDVRRPLPWTMALCRSRVVRG